MITVKSNRVINRRVYSTTLDCGLRVAAVPMEGFNTCFASLTINYGGMDNRYIDKATGCVISIPDGAAHFLEHQLFLQPDGSDASQFFCNRGASCNAMTYWYYTTYLFHTADRNNFAECLQYLMNFVGEPAFTERSIAREAGIIQQEIAGWLDSPWWVSKLGLLQALYQAHPGKAPVMGTMDSVKRISIDDLNRCYRAFYSPENMVLFACGDVDPDLVVRLAEKNTTEYCRRGASGGVRLSIQEQAAVDMPVVIHRMNISCSTVIVGLKCRPYTPGAQPSPEVRLLRRVCAEVLIEALFGETGDLRWELYSGSLIKGDLSMDFWDFGDVNHVYVSGKTDSPEQFADIIKGCLLKARESGIDLESFEPARRTVLGRYLSTLDKPIRLGWKCSAALPLGLDFLEIIPILRALSIDDIKGFMLENIAPDTIAVSMALPYDVEIGG